MFRKKAIAMGVLVTIGSTSLTGCSGSEIARLNSMKSLNSEADNTDYSMTLNEKQSLIYASVAERTLLDLSILDNCSDEEIQQVKQYMNNVDSQLSGSLSKDNGVIDSCFTDYLLSEFEKSPYYWQRTRTAIRGIDSTSRSIIVDVTYNTIGFEKDVLGDSFIAKGSPNYTEKEEVRYNRWCDLLDAEMNGNSDYPRMLDEFVKAYGKPDDIIASQRNLGLTEQIFETGNQRTYTGLVDNDFDQQGGSMTVRYVLVPKYVLGVNLGMECKHMYVTDYEVTNDKTKKYDTFKEDGYTTITDNVSKVINSYFKCIDEADMSGLYKLTDNFNSVDKYYQDLFDTTYTKHGAFSVSLFDIEGTHVKAGVKVASKVRAKGSNMTMPNYTDRYYVELELVDDSLKVTNMTLLSRKLEGEPAITTEEAGKEGFVASIDLSNKDKSDIEKLICDFSSLQLLGDDKSDKFMSIVDYSMSEKKLDSAKKDMVSLGGTKKVVWLQNYQQGTSNYASVKCRELFQQEDNSIIEATVNYEFISKGDKWYIYDYNVLSSLKLNTTNLTTSNSLCYVTPGKVEQYTSQIVSSKGDKKDKADIAEGVVFEHSIVEPVLKNGTKEQGLVKLSANNFTEAQLSDVIKELGIKDLSIEDIDNFDSKVGLSESDSMMNMCKSIGSYYYNKTNNRYSESESKEESDSIDGVVADFKKEATEGIKGSDDSTLKDTLKAFGNFSSKALK